MESRLGWIMNLKHQAEEFRLHGKQLKVFEQGNDAVFYESIFLAVQGLLEKYKYLSLIHISEPTRHYPLSRMPSSA